MRRLKGVGCAFVVMSLVCVFGAVASQASAADQELAQLERELASAKAEYEAYKSQLLDTPLIAGVRKEASDLRLSASMKERDLTAITDKKINNDPTYATLIQRVSQAANAEAQFGDLRRQAETDPESNRLMREADAMRFKGERAKAQALDGERAAAMARKIENNPQARLIKEKMSDAKAAREALAKFRADVMSAPEIKSLQSELARVKSDLAAKNGTLRDMTARALADERLTSLGAKVNELAVKVAALRRAQAPALKSVVVQPQGQRATIVQPMAVKTAVARPAVQPIKAPAPQRSLIERIKTKIKALRAGK